jgi:hypothetical protein
MNQEQVDRPEHSRNWTAILLIAAFVVTVALSQFLHA